MKKRGIDMKNIYLNPLRISDLRILISETLSLPPPQIEPLAVLVYEKTKGNPFFVGRLLNTLHKKRLLVTRHY
jgi:predicted ATPase